ncbi:MAG: DinB family protein [Phycisphaerae bacterium]|nr:DinB family protein [Phycisphaerae bacterium]MCZ2400595.1 DinB family protein [Phycisphaerae bacterium]
MKDKSSAARAATTQTAMTTTTATGTRATTPHLLRLVDEAFDRKAWHGPNLRAATRRVTAELALWRPGPRRHSIAEIALHAAYWKYVTRRRLRGDKRGSFPLKGSNWFAVDSLDEAGWAGVLKLLQEQHRLLRETVAGFAPGRWSSAPPGSKLRYADQVIGVAFHDIYHAGQIQTLKALQRS